MRIISVESLSGFVVKKMTTNRFGSPNLGFAFRTGIADGNPVLHLSRVKRVSHSLLKCMGNSSNLLRERGHSLSITKERCSNSASAVILPLLRCDPSSYRTKDEATRLGMALQLLPIQI